ncbi:MAG: DUF2334 domain-containing protein [Burkholderiales bacterium]|nr:DUF2334 domain-containing protein [Burkholderiales bacterium]
MNRFVRFLLVACALCASFLAAPAQAGPRVLALYDAPQGTPYDKLGFAYAIMLRNLLGHFDAQVDLQPVGSYTAGSLANYDATFYLGAIYDNPIPAAFLADAAVATKPLVWFKYNLWQLAWNSAYNFQATRGIAFQGLRGFNAPPSAANPSPGFFDTVKFKGLNFVKYYAFNSATGVVSADPDIGVTAVTDPTKATVPVSVANSVTGEVAPYMIRSGNFWYVADMPFSFIGPRDRYLVFADQLHDMLGINHAESHQAMVRLEDVGAMVTVSSMKKLSDYLYQRHIPFSVAVIPHYMDPLGVYNGGVPMDVSLSQATNLKTSLDYALQRGGDLVMHGFTHQYDAMRNPHTGVSGDDFEFWNIVANSPVAEDSTSWTLGRLNSGLTELTANGYKVFAWETPHYQASATASRAFAQKFAKTYQRVVYYTADQPDFTASVARDYAVGQIFPYPVRTDYYGQRVLPESLGNIEYDIHLIDPTSNYNYTAQDIITNAAYVKTVRDGVASWFFHPFWLDPDLGVPGFTDFKTTITGITNLGFTWVRASTLP